MDISVVFIIIGLGLISGLTTLIGVGLAFLCKKSAQIIVIGIGFSTGIMILISVAELVPESVRESSILEAALAAAVGAGLAIILNRIIPHTHLVKEVPYSHGHPIHMWRGMGDGANQPQGGHGYRRMVTAAYMIALGLVLHDVPEGFAMANSYIHAPSLGVLVAIAIALHNIPEEFAMAVPLVAVGKSKRSILKIGVLSSLAEPVGALLGVLAIGMFQGLEPIFMGLTAGVMVYISLHELLPMAHAYRKPALLVSGLTLSVAVYSILLFAIPE